MISCSTRIMNQKYSKPIFAAIFRKMSSSAAGDATKSAKNILRKEMKKKVNTITMEERIRQSKLVTEKIFQLPEYISATSISLYLHMKDEIQTEDILTHALNNGKTCYIPRYFGGGNHMEMVRLADFEDYMSLPVTKWNIKQPKDDEFREEALDHGLDMMLVPGMAFTVHGERLGRGKGYYDTYLSKAESKAISPLTVALAFQEQILTELPVTEHDKLIDKVIFPGK